MSVCGTGKESEADMLDYRRRDTQIMLAAQIVIMRCSNDRITAYLSIGGTLEKA
jgi:hypothetical protein